MRDQRLDEDPVVTQEYPQDAGATAGQGSDRLDVLAALGMLLEVGIPLRNHLPPPTVGPSSTVSVSVIAEQAVAVSM